MVPLRSIPTTLAIATCLVLLACVAPPAAGTAKTCLYNNSPPGLPLAPTKGTVTTNVNDNSLAGAVGAPLPCATGLTSKAASCTNVLGVPVPNVAAPGGDAWCDAVVTAKGPFPTTCTITVVSVTSTPPGMPVAVTGMAAGWDWNGPLGNPDGNLDGSDFAVGPNGGAAFITFPFPGIPGGATSVVVYPPASFGLNGFAQLIVYPIVEYAPGFVPPPGATASANVAAGCA